MEDYSSYEKQRRNIILCICFLVSMSIYIHNMCNLCIELLAI